MSSGAAVAGAALAEIVRECQLNAICIEPAEIAESNGKIQI